MNLTEQQRMDLINAGWTPPMTNRDWITYNQQTKSYETPDGTSVAAELVNNVRCLADVLHIAQIRAKQRST
jgi:hypothetical protein